MSNKKGIKYNSKSTIILNKYTPEEIQKLLNSGLTKKAIVANLGVQFKAFDKYIEEHNLTYKTPDRKKPVAEEYKAIENAEEQSYSYALMRYRELIAARKERDKLRPREPEVYHHDLYKKS